uniref:NAD(P)H oxidase (H2O2-forming) n=2 Tax=Hirondellea gigas TaxID=1518452 RepID=A0A6A7G5H1_9CRUS
MTRSASIIPAAARAASVVFLLLAASTPSTGQIPTNMRRIPPQQWQGNSDAYVHYLFTGCLTSSGPVCEPPQSAGHSEYASYDGFYNNLAYPEQGAVDTPLLRLLPTAYRDGVYQPTKRSTNPFTVSEATMKGKSGMVSKAGKTAFLVFFGQQVVEELLDAQRPGCPPEYFNIPIPEDHEFRTADPYPKEMPFLRTRYSMNTGFAPSNPRQQLNEITPYLDGGLVYGVAKGWADVLRAFTNGTLAPHGQLAWHDELGKDFPAANSQRLPMANPPPPTKHAQYVKQHATDPVDRFFKLGNPRGNENPFLLTFGVLLFRWHNKLAMQLHELHPTWSEERLFNEARKWVIATHQSIVMYDWLPKWLRQSPAPYEGYKVTVNPQISHVFQSAAMRFGHTLVTSGVYLRDKASEGCGTRNYTLHPQNHHSAGVRTCNSYWRSPELFKDDPDNIERFLMGLSSQSTEREDNIIVEDLRGRVFGPLEFSRRDLMAINIQRGRDHGLPDYNTARKYFGLRKLSSLEPEHYKNVTGSSMPPPVLARFNSVYRYPNETDIWVGGLMETTLGPGQLFTKIIKDQFERIRDGDRFWFENENNDLFETEERQRIRNTKIIDLILSVTSLTLDDIQEDPFTAVNANNDLPMCRSQLTTLTQCTLVTGTKIQCHYLPPLNSTNLEPCTKLDTFDFFTGSVLGYILTFFSVFSCAVGLLVAMILLSWSRENKRARRKRNTINVSENGIIAKERVSRIESRFVVVNFLTEKRRIDVRVASGNLVRTIDLMNLTTIRVKHLTSYRHVVLQTENHYDLYLMFSNDVEGHKLMAVLQKFCTDCSLELGCVLTSWFNIDRGITTYKKRAAELAEFSRLVINKSFENSSGNAASLQEMTKLSKNSRLAMMQITQSELAAELGTSADTLFMQQLFRLMDKDQNGFILLKEFWDVMVMFSKGSPKDKAQLIFNIYDVSQNGLLSENDLTAVIESMLGTEGKGHDIDMVISSIMEFLNLKRGDVIDFDTFYQLFKDDESVLVNLNLESGGRSTTKNHRFSLYEIRQEEKPETTKPDNDRIDTLIDEESKEVEDNAGNRWKGLMRSIYNHRVYVCWIVLYTLVMFAIFAERAYYYSVEREHGGLRRIAGYGVTVTRGAASAMMFTYSSLLVTMCRNLINQIRLTSMHGYFPVDYMVSLHRYIASWALLWTAIHVIFHAVNFYHIATQTPPDLTCLFRDFFRATHVLPKFQYWCWGTITGFTGILLTLQCAVIYVFAIFARRYYFKLFWITHNSYPFFYLLTILHGSGNLVQEPFFYYFFLGPAMLFTIDKLISTSSNTIKIDVLESHHLPSNVTLLKIRRPPNFSYQAGQWIRIASLAISEQEYHPFTLSSAPHEEHLTVHIRAVGPWTIRLRKEYVDKAAAKETNINYPHIYIDGPFGEGHQTWQDYEIAILIGGGIGVTPFASILKHISHSISLPTFSMKTKKVLFLWVTNSQHQFEWLTEILHDVEKRDTRNIIKNHIFITQFKNKFDMRTIFLYLAERHFQRMSGASLFTGLKAITHFSRPPFEKIFINVKKHYTFASDVGVFTCGNPSLSSAVEEAVRAVNQNDDNVILKHYFDNF